MSFKLKAARLSVFTLCIIAASTTLAAPKHSNVHLASVPADKFYDEWAAVSAELGYPKYHHVGTGSDLTVHAEFINPDWIALSFENWPNFQRTKRFYMAGASVMQGDTSRSGERLKAEVMGLYQCMNTITDFQKYIVRAGVNYTGSIADNLTLCTLGFRVQ